MPLCRHGVDEASHHRLSARHRRRGPLLCPGTGAPTVRLEDRRVDRRAAASTASTLDDDVGRSDQAPGVTRGRLDRRCSGPTTQPAVERSRLGWGRGLGLPLGAHPRAGRAVRAVVRRGRPHGGRLEGDGQGRRARRRRHVEHVRRRALHREPQAPSRRPAGGEPDAHGPCRCAPRGGRRPARQRPDGSGRRQRRGLSSTLRAGRVRAPTQSDRSATS